MPLTGVPCGYFCLAIYHHFVGTEGFGLFTGYLWTEAMCAILMGGGFWFAFTESLKVRDRLRAWSKR